MKQGNKQARKNINFRQTHSERSATESYRNFSKVVKKVQNFKSFGRGK